MAATLQQRVLQRKFIYLGLIFALFTVSLLHRNLTIRRLAKSYQLTEETRGEVELTSSAMRLSLTGFRGLLITYLWYDANEQFDHHEWEKLKVAVNNITKLQPFFITPWLFQSWNLAFNVSVECDRPRDKYYYVSQGLGLLAKGEMRNRGLSETDLTEETGRLKFPGNPDMRYFMGQIYQLKFGSSDEKNVMRSFLEMSCIDPVNRNPDKIRNDPAKFKDLCDQYPRLVRRLRESLKCDTPKKILDFLGDNKDIPSRYLVLKGVHEPTESPVRPWYDQFPRLPDPRERDVDWPDPGVPGKEDESGTPEKKFLDKEWIDVYVVSRTWFSYAQKPLPLPQAGPLDSKPHDYDPVQHRLPKQMSSVIFRGAPARAQAFVAETMQSEGWFGGEGWFAASEIKGEGAYPKTAFSPGALELQPSGKREFRPGKGKFQYHSGKAWQKAYEYYRDFGIQNGLFYPRDELLQLERLAQQFEVEIRASGKDPNSFLEGSGQRDPGFIASTKVMWREMHVTTTGFAGHMAVCEAERTPLAVAARRRFYEANLLRYRDDAQALALYDQAWPLWLQVMLEYPAFAQAIQEDAYEWHLRHLRTLQSQHAPLLKPLTMGLAQLAVFPHPDFNLLMTEGDKERIIPIRTTRGLLDWVQLYDHPNPARFKPILLEWSQAAAAGHGAGWLPLLAHPGQANLLLTRLVPHGTPPPRGWTNLVDSGAVEPVRERLGLKTMAPPDGNPKAMGGS